METSILTGTKKILGLDEDYEVFDHDVITHINAALSTLQQLGVGPEDGFVIEDKGATWEDFIENYTQMPTIKSYIFLRVKMLFDPPATQYLVQASDAQIKQFEWRLNADREDREWVAQVEEEVSDD